jgi:hypothetical protein
VGHTSDVYLLCHSNRFSELRLGTQWFRWKGPTCTANNVLLPSSTWLDYYGPCTLEDVSNGLGCQINFEMATWKNAYTTQHKFSGTVCNADGVAVFAVEGDWSKHIDLVHLDSGGRRRVWELESEPLDRWGRSAYSVMMLSSPPDLYPPTDIRRREDIQALAAGDYVAAGRARLAIEKKRSEMEQVEYEPRLFYQVGERYLLKTKHCHSGCIELPNSGVTIRDKIDSRLPATEGGFHADYSMERAVAVTGVSAGLPRDHRNGLHKGQFGSTENLDRLLDGESFLSVLSLDEKSNILALNVTQMVREAGVRVEKTLDDPHADVMQVASFCSPLDLEQECGLPEHISSAMDTVCQMAIAVGLNALQHAECVDGNGLLHPEMQDSTGIIFASSFGGLDSTVDAVTRSIREGQEYRMDRKLLFKLLVKANSQLAARVKARGPNTSINGACAGTTQALAMAEDWIRLGRCDRVVVLGADNPTSPTSLPWIGAGFLALGAASKAPTVEQAAKPFDRERSGLVLGSASVAIVIEREAVANARRRVPLARALTRCSRCQMAFLRRPPLLMYRCTHATVSAIA